MVVDCNTMFTSVSSQTAVLPRPRRDAGGAVTAGKAKRRRTPGGITEVDALVVPAIKLAQEERAEMVRARPRDGLHARYASLRDHGRVGAKDETRRGSGVFRQARDVEIFVVEGGVIQEDIRRLRGIKSGQPYTAAEHTRTFLTTGSTHGLPLSSRYAPTPRLILSGWVSAL